MGKVIAAAKRFKARREQAEARERAAFEAELLCIRTFLGSKP